MFTVYSLNKHDRRNTTMINTVVVGSENTDVSLNSKKTGVVVFIRPINVNGANLR